MMRSEYVIVIRASPPGTTDPEATTVLRTEVACRGRPSGSS